MFCSVTKKSGFKVSKISQTMFSLGKRKQNRQNEPIGATEYFKEFDPDHIRLSDDRMSVVWQEDDATAYGNVVISYDNQQTHE